MSIRVYNSSNTSWVPAKDMWVYDGSNWRRHTSMKIGDGGAWVEVLAAERTTVSNASVSYDPTFNTTSIRWETGINGISATELITEDGRKITATAIGAFSGVSSQFISLPPYVSFSCTGVGSNTLIGDTLDLRNTSNNYGFTFNFANSGATYNANTGVTQYIWYGSGSGPNPIYTNIFASGPFSSNGYVSTSANTTIEWNIAAQSIPGSGSYNPVGGTSGSPTYLEDYQFDSDASVTITFSGGPVTWSYVRTYQFGGGSYVSVANNGSSSSITFTQQAVGGYGEAQWSVQSGGQYWTVVASSDSSFN